MATHESEQKNLENMRTLLTYAICVVLCVMFVVVIVLAIKLAARPKTPIDPMTPITDLVTKTKEPTAAPSVAPTATATPNVAVTVEPTQEPSTGKLKYIVTNKRVNLREKADSSSNKVDTVDAGTIFPLIGYEEDWAIIDYNGTQVYIYGIYVDETDTP